LRREIVAHAASVLVLDGLVAAEAYASTDLELKKFIHELQTLAAAAECTMFLLTSSGMGADGSVLRPEHTMVDGIISLHDTEHGWRVERDVLVRKLRGSDHLRGRHALCITSDGIVVWPRTESLPLSAQRRPRDPSARLPTGATGLDAMIGGGIPLGSSTVVLGPAGAGKTALALQFLAGCGAQQPGIFVGFYETPERLVARAQGLAPHLPALVKSGAVLVKWYGDAEGLIDRVAHELLEAVRLHRARRVVIDGLLGFEDMTVQPERIPHFYKALADHLHELGVTSLCTAEVRNLTSAVAVAPSPLQRLSTVAENLILMHHVEAQNELRRFISVMKLRDSGFDPRLRSFTIGEGGIVLDGNGAGTAGRTDGARHLAPPGG
jgi:circadian clock protein KaiC